MIYFKNLSLIFLLFFSTSCKKAETNNGTSQTAPANLVISATPSTDGRGNVTFTATAQNAVAYTYELGNGVIKSSTDGVLNYQYTTVGAFTYTVFVTATSSNGLTLKKSIDVSITVATPVLGLVWSDEFNTDGAPDPTKWGYDIGTGSNGWGNSELEYYTSRSENVIVQNGVLKIKAIKENYSGSSYTSARLLSKDKYAITYGKVEIRAKMPFGIGTWPAIWMLGSNSNTVAWPACGEIDIMEHLGRDLNNIYGTLHYPDHSGGNANGKTMKITNATTEFHIYGLEWTANSIIISVDGVAYHTVPNSTNIPFNHDFFFILNVAMGGNFAGAVDPSFSNSTMEIDYIRVYK